ncbi:MAG: undecaprenyldiphospho-muramoylpentapeptide beta-N-acetylglucosaminyltransferase [Burkholderiaceae bacterium]
MSHPKRLMVVAAGTGGHVMPGLAVAKELAARGWQVSWLGTQVGMERGLVEKQGIAFDALDFSGLRGKGLKTALLGGFKLLAAIAKSRGLIGRRQPAVMFTTGGYVAVPAGLAASTRGLPLVLMNCDAGPLMSNRILQPLASAVMLGFEGEAARAAGDKGLVTGNPVRREIVELPAPAARFEGRSGPLKLLVFGGSLGAKVLNDTLPVAIGQIPAAQRPTVVHQCGVNAVEAVRAAYSAAGVEAEVLPFIDDMAARYAACDLVIARAGATTVSELAAAGVPAILVPLVVKTTSHQRGNAEFMAAHGAAIHLPQNELTPACLAEQLIGLSRESLKTMAERARAIGQPQAAKLVADAIEHIAKEAA